MGIVNTTRASNNAHVRLWALVYVLATYPRHSVYEMRELCACTGNLISSRYVQEFLSIARLPGARSPSWISQFVNCDRRP